VGKDFFLVRMKPYSCLPPGTGVAPRVPVLRAAMRPPNSLIKLF